MPGVAPHAPDPARDHRRAVLLLALCGALWSTGGVLIKQVEWNAAAIWATRSAIAAAVLCAARRPSLRRI